MAVRRRSSTSELPIHATIRVADLRDAGAIAAVQVASWRTTYPGIVAQEYIDHLSVEERTLAWERRFLGEARALFDAVVAETTSGTIVGFASGGRIREPQPGFDAELYAIYLVQDAQRGGIGRRLLADWARRATARGLQSAVARVLEANPARGFYERMGARWVKDGLLEIDGQSYPEVWYGWDALGALTAP